MPTAAQNAQSLLFYPLVGLLIGAALWGMAHLLQFLPLVLSSSLILVLWIWLTGGLHLDGLADTADAWVGGFGDPERSLNIMKDPKQRPDWSIELTDLLFIKMVCVVCIARTTVFGIFAVSYPYRTIKRLGFIFKHALFTCQWFRHCYSGTFA